MAASGRVYETGRWTAHRKAAVLKEIAAGELSVSEAMSRWDLSLEELQSWDRDYRRYGLRGLKTTGVQDIRAGRGPNIAQHGGRRPGSGRPTKGSRAL
jgi:hypothetical protein